MPSIYSLTKPNPAEDLLGKVQGPYSTILADPPWQFQNRTGKMAPEHRRLLRYPTMELKEIMELPVVKLAAASSHLYLWVPNALLQEGLRVMEAWGFTYKSNLVWYKIRKDGGPDGRGVGFYFRNVTELILFGVRGGMRTLQPGRTQVNLLSTCCLHVNVNTPENRMKFMIWSSPVRRAPTSNYLPDFAVKAGINGEMRMWRRIPISMSPSERRISSRNCVCLRVQRGIVGKSRSTQSLRHLSESTTERFSPEICLESSCVWCRHG